MKIKDFKELLVWQKGIAICANVYKLTSSFPSREQFGLVSQMRRAAISIPSNISEGFNRRNPKEFIQYLHISLGSCAELETQLIISQRINLVTNSEDKDITEVVVEEAKMLRGLIKKIRSTASHN